MCQNLKKRLRCLKINNLDQFCNGTFKNLFGDEVRRVIQGCKKPFNNLFF